MCGYTFLPVLISASLLELLIRGVLWPFGMVPRLYLYPPLYLLCATAGTLLAVYVWCTAKGPGDSAITGGFGGGNVASPGAGMVEIGSSLDADTGGGDRE